LNFLLNFLTCMVFPVDYLVTFLLLVKRPFCIFSPFSFLDHYPPLSTTVRGVDEPFLQLPEFIVGFGHIHQDPPISYPLPFPPFFPFFFITTLLSSRAPLGVPLNYAPSCAVGLPEGNCILFFFLHSSSSFFADQITQMPCSGQNP